MEKIIKILEKTLKTGKDGRNFLILKTNPEKIYVFPGIIPEKFWDRLVVGNSYCLQLSEGKRESKVLRKFQRIATVDTGEERVKVTVYYEE